jgi:hypothetical protein
MGLAVRGREGDSLYLCNCIRRPPLDNGDIPCHSHPLSSRIYIGPGNQWHTRRPPEDSGIAE